MFRNPPYSAADAVMGSCVSELSMLHGVREGERDRGREREREGEREGERMNFCII